MYCKVVLLECNILKLSNFHKLDPSEDINFHKLDPSEGIRFQKWAINGKILRDQNNYVVTTIRIMQYPLYPLISPVCVMGNV